MYWSKHPIKNVSQVKLMETKAIVAIAVVAVLVVSGATAGILLLNNSEKEDKISQYSYDEAELKVLGNVDGNRVIDEKDYNELKKLVDSNAEVEKYPLADANNDKVIDDNDLQLVRDIIDKKPSTVYHISYHDVDGDGVMDLKLSETKWPVTSTIMTGSSNSFMLFYLLGIIDEVKGASYGSTNDTTLFGSNYLNTEKVTKLDSSSQTIAFEDGKNTAASNLIKTKGVTCVVSDWNRTYVPNEDIFEKNHVDVVRVAAASFDRPVYTHSILLLGFLFQKEDRATLLVDLYNEAKDVITGEVGKLSDSQKVKATASSMEGMLSSADSDYTAVALDAGAKYGLEGFNFTTGSTSIKVADNLGVYDTTKFSWDYIIHIRTSLSYGQDAEKINSEWLKYTASFAKWEHAETGQVFISGVIPIPARVAYTAYAMYGDQIPTFSKAWADNIHQSFIGLYDGNNSKLKAAEKTFVLKDNPTTKIVYLAEDCSVLYDGEEHAISVTPVTSGCTVTYSTDGVNYTADNPTYSDYGSNKVYFRIVCEGRDTVEGYKTVSVNHELQYTITDYNGVVDGSKHGITVTVTDPPSGATIKYYSSQGYVKTYGKNTQDNYMIDAAGETTIWVYIVADGYQEVIDSGKVILTAAS